MNLINEDCAEKLEGKVNIPIVLATDSNYLPYAAATLESIMAHANAKHMYHIFLLKTDICDEEAIGILKNQCFKRHNFSFKSLSILEFIDNNFEGFNKSINKMSHFSLAIYGRIIIPKIFSSFDRVIYTDIDIIYQRDIAELMFMDIEDNMIAAVPELTTEVDRYFNIQKTLKRLRSLNLNDNETYINSGLLVFNIKKCIEANFLDKIIHFINENSLKFPDQDAINAICKSNIFYLSQVWNCTTDDSNFIHKMDSFSASVSNSNKAFRLFNEWLEVSNKDTTCFHYMGGSKPWNIYSGFKVYLFWDYFKKTPFFVSYLSKMITNRTAIHVYNSLNDIKIYYSIFGIPLGHFLSSANERSFSIGKIKIYKTTLNINKEKIYILGIRVLTKKYRAS